MGPVHPGVGGRGGGGQGKLNEVQGMWQVKTDIINHTFHIHQVARAFTEIGLQTRDKFSFCQRNYSCKTFKKYSYSSDICSKENHNCYCNLFQLNDPYNSLTP